MCGSVFPRDARSWGMHRRSRLLLPWTNCCETSVCRRRGTDVRSIAVMGGDVSSLRRLHFSNCVIWRIWQADHFRHMVEFLKVFPNLRHVVTPQPETFNLFHQDFRMYWWAIVKQRKNMFLLFSNKILETTPRICIQSMLYEITFHSHYGSKPIGIFPIFAHVFWKTAQRQSDSTFIFQFLPQKNKQTVGWMSFCPVASSRSSSRIVQCLFSHRGRWMTNFHVPAEENDGLSMMLPPSCFTMELFKMVVKENMFLN